MNYSKPHAWLHRINNTRHLVATQPTFYSSQQPQQPHLNNLIPTFPAYMETPPERASSSLLLVLCPQNCLKTSISKHCQTQLFLVQRITRYRGFVTFWWSPFRLWSKSSWCSAPVTVGWGEAWSMKDEKASHDMGCRLIVSCCAVAYIVVIILWT